MLTASAYMCYNVLYQAFVVRGYSLFDNTNETARSALPVRFISWVKTHASMAVAHL